MGAGGAAAIAVDTIAGIATATGPAGVGIVRVSGPAAIAIATALTGRAASGLPDRLLVRAVVRDARGRRLDDGLVVAMRGPRTFTGDDVVELQVHGGPVNLGRVLAAAVAAGARIAEPGELTRRALAAGKLTVVEAEAMLAVVEARTERAWALAQAHLGGQLGAAVAQARAAVADLVAELEAHIDFPEEDLPALARDRLGAGLAASAAAAARLVASFGVGRVAIDGLRVAIVGAVNVGKSALLNALVGRERALVSPEAGTTRDYVEVAVVWDGVAITLIDTAGWRADAAGLEERGIALGRARADECDVVLELCGPGEAPRALGPRALGVATKADLGGAAEPGWLVTSAVTGAGLAELRAEIVARAGLADDVEAGSAVLLTERQRAAAAEAERALTAAAGLLAGLRPLELVAVEARTGLAALAALGGEGIGEDVLDRLFARFCIGK
ncbi:MAG: 50S ribosome-binding GTPase [Myxococcales bacterium]|nr:50S ribosome-binding GTPase [Myxococcales bacterium]